MNSLLRFLVKNKICIDNMSGCSIRVWRGETSEEIDFNDINEVIDYILDHPNEEVKEFWWMEKRKGKSTAYNIEIFEE